VWAREEFDKKCSALGKELEEKEFLKTQAEATLRSEREAMESCTRNYNDSSLIL
jgi:hypothetical protein